MAVNACTSYYKVTIIGWSIGSSTAINFANPTPIASNVTGGTIYQCSAVTLGGFNGLNN
jgi:hypothetical protein